MKTILLSLLFAFASQSIANNSPRLIELKETSNFVVDRSHSSVNFNIRHLISKVYGKFRKFSGRVTIGKDFGPDTKMSMTIQSTSINTNELKRDNHLRSKDFFDVLRYPAITFNSTRVIPKGGRKATVYGNFTMKGFTKEVAIEMEYFGATIDSFGNQKVGFAGTTTLNRKDFGITYNTPLEMGGWVIGDTVNVDISLEALKHPFK